MAKYIHKQAAIYALVNEANLHKNPIKRAYARAAAIIEQITAEDVQPVRRGKWEDTISCFIDKLGAYYITSKCSCCSEWSDKVDDDAKMSNEYCSHCGADMRGEDNAESNR